MTFSVVNPAMIFSEATAAGISSWEVRATTASTGMPTGLFAPRWVHEGLQLRDYQATTTITNLAGEVDNGKNVEVFNFSDWDKLSGREECTGPNHRPIRNKFLADSGVDGN